MYQLIIILFRKCNNYESVSLFENLHSPLIWINISRQREISFFAIAVVIIIPFWKRNNRVKRVACFENFFLIEQSRPSVILGYYYYHSPLIWTWTFQLINCLRLSGYSRDNTIYIYIDITQNFWTRFRWNVINEWFRIKFVVIDVVEGILTSMKGG